MRLHGTRRVILMLHSDCGAYGGLAGGFGGNTSLESERLHAELRRAAGSLWKAIPGLQIDAYFVDFEGIWETELEAA